MAASPRTARYLKDALRLAHRLETIGSAPARTDYSGWVAYGTLVRQRRLAEAVMALGRHSSFESQILLRSMVEIHFNSEWLLGRGRRLRAKRYILFHPLEQLSVFDRVEGRRADKARVALRRRMVAKRSKVRYLFRNRGSDGKLHWDRSWARLMSFEARMQEVLRRRKAKDPTDAQFFYGIYSWFSSAVHGGPLAMRSALKFSGNQPLPKAQPELDPRANLAAALTILQATISTVGRILGLLKLLEPDYSRVSKAVKEVGKARGPLWRGA